MTLVVRTCRLGARHLAAASRGLLDALDVTRKSGDAFGQVFAPSWSILRPVLEARTRQKALFIGAPVEEREALSEQARAIELAAWEAYVPAFIAEMRASYRAHRDAWEMLLARERVVLCCYCKAPERCHRTILAGVILPKLGAIFAGEVLPPRRASEAA